MISLTAIRRLRIACFVLVVVSGAMIAASSRYALRAVYRGGSSSNWQVALDGGTLVLFWADDRGFFSRMGRAFGPGFSTETEKRWNDDISLAWRPYHIGARPGFNTGDTHHGLVIPLWLIALPAAVGGAYCHGHLKGFRRGDRSCCSACGYSRSGLESAAPCPECGSAGHG